MLCKKLFTSRALALGTIIALAVTVAVLAAVIAMRDEPHPTERRISAHITGQLWINTSIILFKEVHVRAGASLSLGEGATIWLVNGETELADGDTINRATLAFDSGSSLYAPFGVRIRSVDVIDGNVQELVASNVADNGGIVFCGTASNITLGDASNRANFTSVLSTTAAGASNFVMQYVNADHLGSAERGLDAVTLLSVSKSEMRTEEIYSVKSGRDGFRAWHSTTQLRVLGVFNSTRGALALEGACRLYLDSAATFEVANVSTAGTGLYVGELSRIVFASGMRLAFKLPAAAAAVNWASSDCNQLRGSLAAGGEQIGTIGSDVTLLHLPGTQASTDAFGAVGDEVILNGVVNLLGDIVVIQSAQAWFGPATVFNTNGFNVYGLSGSRIFATTITVTGGGAVRLYGTDSFVLFDGWRSDPFAWSSAFCATNITKVGGSTVTLHGVATEEATPAVFAAA
jgi:hypothetical protein